MDIEDGKSCRLLVDTIGSSATDPGFKGWVAKTKKLLEAGTIG